MGHHQKKNKYHFIFENMVKFTIKKERDLIDSMYSDYITSLPDRCRCFAFSPCRLEPDGFIELYSQFQVISPAQDGHCLFKVIADCCNGDESLFMQVRQQTAKLLNFDIISAASSSVNFCDRIVFRHPLVEAKKMIILGSL